VHVIVFCAEESWYLYSVDRAAADSDRSQWPLTRFPFPSLMYWTEWSRWTAQKPVRENRHYRSAETNVCSKVFLSFSLSLSHTHSYGSYYILGIMSNINGAHNSAVGWGAMLQTGRSWVFIPEGVIGLFNLPNPSSRTMALGSTQPLTEMSTRNLPGVKGRPVRKADNLTAICEPTV
jgi:hypothetical protein